MRGDGLFHRHILLGGVRLLRVGEQLKLVTSFDWIDFDALKGVDILIRKALSEPQAADFVGQDRVEVIAGAVQQRVQTLQSTAMTPRPL